MKGFRDIYHELINDYKFHVRMPTCTQLAENTDEQDNLTESGNAKKVKKLTTKQAAETRLVTKVVFKLN